jgi:hypothetical protein
LSLSHRTKSTAIDKCFYFCYFQLNYAFQLTIYHFSLAEELSRPSPIPAKISPSFTRQLFETSSIESFSSTEKYIYIYLRTLSASTNKFLRHLSNPVAKCKRMSTISLQKSTVQQARTLCLQSVTTDYRSTSVHSGMLILAVSLRRAVYLKYFSTRYFLITPLIKCTLTDVLLFCLTAVKFLGDHFVFV